MKKMKRFNEGDVVEFETKQGPNKNISDDIREKAIRAVAEGGQKDEAPAPKKAAPKATPKAEPKATPKAEPKADTKSQPDSDREENSSWMRQFRKDEAKAAASTKAVPELVRKAYQDAAKIKPMKEGGKVSSASSRADGCATKGKTKGTMISMCGGGKM
jgi:Cu/Ag efflux protein CusF